MSRTYLYLPQWVRNCNAMLTKQATVESSEAYS